MKLIFSFAAPFYDKIISSVGEEAYGAALHKAFEKLKEPKEILGMSTGTGFLALYAAEKFPRRLVVATDVSLQMLLTAVKNAKARGLELNFVLADSRCPPFRDASFELVATHNAPPYIAEMKRVSVGKLLTCYSFGGVLFNFAVNKILEYLKKNGLEANSEKTCHGIYFIAQPSVG